MTAKILDGRRVAREIRADLKEKVLRLQQRGVVPKLVVILVGNDTGSEVYIRNKKRAAEAIGIETLDVRLPAETSEYDLLKLIAKYNADESIDGILVQLPLPPHINEDTVEREIDPRKDVDGFHPINMGHLFMNEPNSLPCTPRGIMALLAAEKIEVAGKHVVIVGRSNIVGRPMAALMLNHDATVTIAHSHTKDLAVITRQADILIVAVGKPEMITADYVRDGAVVIDVGMNRNAAGKLVGDVAQEEVAQKAGYITPVPGGVGPMTIAMLMQQVVEFAERNTHNDK
ncbi:bifunctional methylenetetrahydrofolate dehydrogenase/methenyltetrahydrofolate cyclohydrolase FolD [Ligilactobacillus hohenheimensis]|uniref:bifunctional methylenetetrahydrofolate dehydrogenase/methenyltetrahydrofolate cyclohydrolase FolD n=1 Tax=Ligilactobacillus hohenheimensis TaxID=2991832 RepID=UPI0024B879AB|nr:bifunctional methylenetetrahydrofolate dehydrogenase/methenyltetrahydrofolate cyclohydrolase FolD [Ligilactobacillus hohenheimensis]